MKGNVAIARFMGAIKSKIDGDSRYLRFPEPHAGTNTYSFYPSQLKYNSLWNWQIPVYSSLHIAVSLLIEGKELNGYNLKKWEEEYENAIFNDEVEKGHKTIIEMLEWYNQSNTKQNT